MNENPFDYAPIENNSIGADQTGDVELPKIIILERMSPLLKASFLSVLVGISAWCTFVLLVVILRWREGDFNRVDIQIMGVSSALWSTIWPGYWLLKSTARIHRAVEEPTLSSIADVLEAQRSFWQALGILVLLAIAAIVVSATYPHWSELFA